MDKKVVAVVVPIVGGLVGYFASKTQDKLANAVMGALGGVFVAEVAYVLFPAPASSTVTGASALERPMSIRKDGDGLTPLGGDYGRGDGGGNGGPTPLGGPDAGRRGGMQGIAQVQAPVGMRSVRSAVQTSSAPAQPARHMDPRGQSQGPLRRH